MTAKQRCVLLIVVDISYLQCQGEGEPGTFDFPCRLRSNLYCLEALYYR